MKKNRSKLFCVGYLGAAMAMLLFVLTMAACDSNSGSSGGGGGAGAARQGIVVDSAIEGFEYETPTYSGLTDRSGRFQYAEGETVSFFIGDLLIGEARSKAVISPLDLVPDAADETHPAVINMARLLQTMDWDGNSYNGIKIADSSRKLLTGFHSIDFDQSADDFSNDPDVQALLGILNKGGVFGRKKRMLYDADTALRHLRHTLQEHPSITIKTPNGGEELMAEADCEITWKAVSFIKNVAILVSTDGGATWNDTPITASTPNDGSYIWDAVPTALKSTQCRFRIADADAIAENESIAAASARVVHDDTDKDFTIHLTKGTVMQLIQMSTAEDSDDDGLPDDVEQMLGTSPNNRDSDNDGVSDYDEIFGGTGYEPDQPLADQDNDGIIAALDPDENQKPPIEGPDRDGDGLTDKQEIKGWEIWPDRYGLGLGTDTFGQMDAHYKVTSDPDNADTDGDGLDDYIEYLILSDPRKIDTDEDGLTDAEEHIRWHTSPSSVDTDGDSRGPGGDLAQNTSLFDGRELFSEAELAMAPGTRSLRMDATSPILEDTDGDGVTDFEEYLNPKRSALISDLPKVEIKLEDLLDIRLNVEYAEEKGTEFQYGRTETISGEESRMKFDNNSTEKGLGFEIGVEGGYASQGGHFLVHADYHMDWRWGHSWGWEETTTAGWQNENSEYKIDSQTYTETASSGSITAGVRITNPGYIAYHLDNLALTVRFLEPSLDPETSKLLRSFKTMATLTPVLEGGVSLAPGVSTPVLQFQADEVNAERVKMFLAQPSSILLEPAYFDLETADGINFAFIEEVTYARTASVSIDFGNGDPEKYRFATNVDRRSDGTLAGVNLFQFLTENLNIPIETKMLFDDQDNPVSTILSQVRELPEDEPGIKASWLVMGTGSDFGDPSVDFEDIMLQAGDEVYLILRTDRDGDGLSNLGEDVLGTSDDSGSKDTDGDGISDFEEAKGFTDDNGEFVSAGWIVDVRYKAPYVVVSDPRAADADGDGLNDIEERGGCAIDGLLSRDFMDQSTCMAENDRVWHPFQGYDCICGEESGDSCDTADDRNTCEANNGTWIGFGTDPNNPDTDADGIPDNEDSFPTVPAVILYVKAESEVGDGPKWATAFRDLETAISEARARNSDNPEENDVAAIWVAEGQYTPTTTIELPSNVGIYGGFTGIEDKFSQRNPDPFTNGTAIVGQESGDYRAFDVIGVKGVVLDGFTISHFSHPISGGALAIKDSGITLRNIYFSINSADNGGALSIDNNGDSKIEIDHCIFSDNEARHRGGGAGGAILLSTGTSNSVTIRHCEFLDNSAGKTGGAIDYKGDGSLNIGTSLFDGNKAGDLYDVLPPFYEGPPGGQPPDPPPIIEVSEGGAIRMSSSLTGPKGETTLTNCRFARNSSICRYSYGGAIYAKNIQGLVITGCVFFDNSANSIYDLNGIKYGDGNAGLAGEAWGSALLNFSSVTSITNSTIIGNTCIGKNKDYDRHGAVTFDSSGGSRAFINIANSIAAHNKNGIPGSLEDGDNFSIVSNLMYTPGAAPKLFKLSHTCVYPHFTNYDNELQDGYLGDLNIFNDPGLDSNWESTGIPKLQSSSPLIDAGNSYVDTNPIAPGVQYLQSIDFAGNPRVVDGNGDGTAHVDIGAYEFQEAIVK